MTIEVLEDLKNMGIKIEVTPSWQENLFPIIDLFYNTFKNELKKVNINGNLVEFRELLGEEYYNEFSQILFMCGFKAKRSIKKEEKIEISTDKIKLIERLVLDMKLHYDSLSPNNKKTL